MTVIRCISRGVLNMACAITSVFCSRCKCIGQARTRPTRLKLYLLIAFCGLTLWFMRNLDRYEDELSSHVVALRKFNSEDDSNSHSDSHLQLSHSHFQPKTDAQLLTGSVEVAQGEHPDQIGDGNSSRNESVLRSQSQSQSPLEGSCKLPVLELYPTSLKFPKATPLRCSGDERWTYVRDGQVWFNQSAVKEHGSFECVATPFSRSSDFEVGVDSSRGSYKIENGSIVRDQVFRLDCVASKNKSQSLLHHAIASCSTFNESSNSNNARRRKSKSNANGKSRTNPLRGVNVLLLGFDTMSRLGVIRHMPSTYQYFVNKMRGYVMDAYGVYGDGTPAALCPLLTGISEEKLPEARRGFPNASTVDDWPWIWREYKRAGYATLWHEETPDYGTFTYRMLGFDRQPVDFYGRNFEIPLAKLVGSASLCYGAEPKYRILLDWLKQFLSLCAQSPKFALVFHSELTHDENRIELIDAEVRQLLQSVYEDGRNRNSIIILFSDHGPRFNAMRRTFQGKYEERLPFMGVSLPPDWYDDAWVRQNLETEALAQRFISWRDQVVANLRANVNVLSLPFDAHATLTDILRLSQLDSVDQFGQYNVTIERPNARATSLLRPLATDRNCENLGIKAHWCTCLRWTPVEVDNALVKKAAAYFINFVNRLLEQVQVDSQCAQLQLARVVSVGKLSANENVLRFKSSSDQHGRVADLSDTMNLEFFWLQLTIATLPNDGLYEATIRVHPLSGNKQAAAASVSVSSPSQASTQPLLSNLSSPTSEARFEMTEREISRINVYGSAPNCIADQYPHLRPYCFCI